MFKQLFRLWNSLAHSKKWSSNPDVAGRILYRCCGLLRKYREHQIAQDRLQASLAFRAITDHRFVLCHLSVWLSLAPSYNVTTLCNSGLLQQSPSLWVWDGRGGGTGFVLFLAQDVLMHAQRAHSLSCISHSVIKPKTWPQIIYNQ